MRPLISSLSSYIELARLHKPAGALLLFWPCLWGLALGGEGLPGVKWVALFFVGTILMRGAGCAYNDLVDQKIDREVERTKIRPLASGQLSPRQALIFIALLCAIAFYILTQFPERVVWWGVASLGLVLCYPWMKRITYWPQLFLGLTFNWGVWLGWLTVQDTIAYEPILLYVGGILWTLSYDTIYAHQDKEDDLRIGVKSSALYLGERTTAFLWVINALMLLCFFVAGMHLGGVYFLGLGVMAAYVIWQGVTLDIHNSTNCWVRFKMNNILGLVLVISIVLSKTLH